MGRISKIIKGIGSGLVELGRKAEMSIGSFERIFGKIDGPETGMASQSSIMKRAAADSGSNKLKHMVSLRKTKKENDKRRRRFL